LGVLEEEIINHGPDHVHQQSAHPRLRQ
jgi:hypothetical protein